MVVFPDQCHRQLTVLTSAEVKALRPGAEQLFRRNLEKEQLSHDGAGCAPEWTVIDQILAMCISAVRPDGTLVIVQPPGAPGVAADAGAGTQRWYLVVWEGLDRSKATWYPALCMTALDKVSGV